MIKCTGCGVLLQDKDQNAIGYAKDINHKLCLRCFKIKNYNEYTSILKNNDDYLNILKEINKTDDLVVLVVDVFDIPKNLSSIREIIDNDILLVITKRDILPLSVYDNNLIDYFNKYGLNPLDIVLVSSKKNYNFDELYNNINRYKKSNNVYVVGYTNAGKSTLINKIIYNYSDNQVDTITVSNMPATTLDIIEVKVNDSLTLIDTPGLLGEIGFMDNLNKELAKKIIPKSEIKPIVYQIKSPQTILVEDFLRLDLESQNDLVFYFSNQLKIERFFNKKENLKNLEKHELIVYDNSDIVITGLGFIKVKKGALITLYVPKDISVHVRDSLI